MEEITVRVRQRHRSAGEWHGLLTAWKQSGKTREVWCREQGVSRESLRRWTKRLNRSDTNAPLVEVGTGSSVVAQLPAMHLRIRPNGDVELLGEFNEELLRRVLRVAREASHVC